jgi:hypothetical protein
LYSGLNAIGNPTSPGFFANPIKPCREIEHFLPLPLKRPATQNTILNFILNTEIVQRNRPHPEKD